MKGCDHHERNLYGEEHPDDHDEHHGGVVCISLSPVLLAPSPENTNHTPDIAEPTLLTP